ncbi:MAG: hypothetical protein ACJ8EY_05620 [Sphingomicrobium sp.]
MRKARYRLAMTLLFSAGATPALAVQPVQFPDPTIEATAPSGFPEPQAGFQGAQPAVEAPPEYDSRAAILNVANWVVGTNDHGGLPFMVLDKKGAIAFMFDPEGQLAGETAVLIGSAEGDQSIPDIGNRELKEIRIEERTTPAGRFVMEMGPALGKFRRVLWVNFQDSIALHPVITSNPEEQRTKRLKSESPLDNRITYGCINVPADFYAKVVRPLFFLTHGIAYILPEHGDIASFIPGYRPDFPASAPRLVMRSDGGD